MPRNGTVAPDRTIWLNGRWVSLAEWEWYVEAMRSLEQGMDPPIREQYVAFLRERGVD